MPVNTTLELKPCPFCGGSNCDLDYEDEVRVYCFTCGSEGRSFPYANPDGAVHAWNKRSTWKVLWKMLRLKLGIARTVGYGVKEE